MTTNLNKKILITAELKSSSVGVFFGELGFELFMNYTEGETYAFAVDNACPDILNVPRLQISQSIYPKLLPAVRGYVSDEFFKYAYGKKLLMSHFSEAEEFDLVERYSKNLKTIYTVKIHDYLNIGFFVDSIIIEAYRSHFDITKMRSYLNAALNFAFNKIEVDHSDTPIDVSYSHDDDAFAVQISMKVDNFEGKDELKDIFDNLTASSNYFDVTYFEKKNKLTISSLTFKDPKMQASRSYFFTEVIRRSAENEVGEVKSTLYSGLLLKSDVAYEGSTEENNEARKLAIARKFALFIKKCRKREDSPLRLEKDDLDAYLSFYPRQEALEDITPEIKEHMFRILKDDEVYLGISEYIQKVSGTNLNDQVKEIQNVLKMKSLADLEEMVDVGSEDGEENKFQFKEWLEREEEIQRIPGGPAQPLSEVWEVKKNQLSAVIQDEFARIFSEGRSIIQDDIIQIVAQSLNANKNEIQPIVEWIVEEAISSEMVKNKQIKTSSPPIRGDNEKLEEEFANKLLSPAAPSNDLIKEKLESQVLRMKKLMEQMKNELLRLKTEKETEEQNPNDYESERMRLSNALERAMSALKGKDRFIEKLKEDQDLLAHNGEIKTGLLEARIETLKAEYARSKEFANEEKLEKLTLENKSLLARLNLANKKVNIISGNVENREEAIEEKYDKEIDALKLSVQMAQTLIERLKFDKSEMETKFQEERELLKNSIDELNGVPKRDGPIQILTSEKKALEEKLRAQSIELKKVEQKLKYTTSQLDSSSGKKANTATLKSNEAYAKQLDLMNMRMENANQEVAEKRKDLIKLKQEHALMSTRVIELERKLAAAEKKAA